MSDKNIRSEHGQNLLVFAVLMVIFVALAALVIDGGFALSKRRESQNAADAGALAGANALCALNPPQTAYDAAWDYAVNRNHALTADILVDDEDNLITVTTTIPHQTFLAGIIGSDIVTTTATASAGCASPCAGVGVLPVAWACEPPAGGTIGDECAIDYGTVDEPGPIYIIMDSNKAGVDYLCQSPPNSGMPSGALDCDFDDDGTDDLIVGGGRSWLDLDGDDGGHSIDPDWITGGFQEEIPVHIWLPGSDGNSANIFDAARTRTGDYVILPVFNDYTVACDPSVDPACSDKWHTDPLDQIHQYSATSADYYHIITFSVFKITCVSKVPGQHCPTKDFLVSSGVIDHQVKTVEGYFVEGYVPGLGGSCNYGAGAYTIYLNH